MKVRALLYILLILGFSGGLLISSPVHATPHTLLGSAPIEDFSASKLLRWQQILESSPSETYNMNIGHTQKWHQFINSLQNAPKLRQLLKVNLWFKQFPYKQDNWVYKEDDYWATPVEFLTKGGDCEDYAIIKYITLRKLGFPAQDMKIAMVYDVYSGTDHSFLVVKHEGAEFVLDNREKLVVSRYMKKRYKPHYAFNEDRVWMYDSPIMVQKMRQHLDGAILPGNR